MITGAKEAQPDMPDLVRHRTMMLRSSGNMSCIPQISELRPAVIRDLTLWSGFN